MVEFLILVVLTSYLNLFYKIRENDLNTLNTLDFLYCIFSTIILIFMIIFDYKP